MGDLIPFKMTVPNVDFAKVDFWPEWLRHISERQSGLTRVDKLVLNGFIKVFFETFNNRPEEDTVTMEEALTFAGWQDTPITRWFTNHSYSKLITLGYINPEKNEWTRLLPWVSKRQIGQFNMRHQWVKSNLIILKPPPKLPSKKFLDISFLSPRKIMVLPVKISLPSRSIAG